MHRYHDRNTARIARKRPEFEHIKLRCFTTNNGSTEIENRYLDLTDEELMRQCEVNTFKASGPGGQHRNKRESAVRLKHLPTGVVSQV